MAHSSNTETHAGDQSWFERPGNIRLMIGLLVLTCAGLVAADLFYENPHPHFDLEKTFGFQAWFGFVAFVAVVFLGRLLRLIIKRPEDYYDR
tara:strand:+ start:110664 stop:110939 length:276 start_codon:yes stop_codon:yes gene_type:complete